VFWLASHYEGLPLSLWRRWAAAWWAGGERSASGIPDVVMRPARCWAVQRICWPDMRVPSSICTDRRDELAGKSAAVPQCACNQEFSVAAMTDRLAGCFNPDSRARIS